jgi:hypothetical protein
MYLVTSRRWECTVRVVVVEDEVRLAETIRRGLLSAMFVVDVEHRGDDGFHTALFDQFDAIILDIMLPGKRLRDRQGTPAPKGCGLRCSCSPPRTVNTTWPMPWTSVPMFS